MKQQADPVTTIDNHAVEAVARAICVTDGDRPDRDFTSGNVTMPCWKSYTSRAYAAIAAIRPYHFEEAAGICDAERESFLSPEYATDQPLSSIRERFAAGSCAEAIRAAK